MAEETATYLVRIDGRVQGVWYRAWTKEEATKRNVAGWVRNRKDGSVEILISGAPSDVQEMLKAFHDGPPAARVDAVTAETAPAPEGTAFEQRPTA